MIDPTTIQIIIQGGAVGLLLVFGVGVYRLARHTIDLGSAFINNHMAHLTATLERLDKSIDRLIQKE